MQKIRLQIMVSQGTLNTIHNFQLKNNLKNESAAIEMLIVSYNRLQTVIGELEKKAHEAEEWKQRAEHGMEKKDIIVPDAKKSTDTKQKSAENTKNTRKQGGKP